MKKIKHAKFLRSIETDAAITAEVEFAWEGDFGAETDNEKYIAVLKKDGNEDYNVERIMKKSASYELDWYDNADHQAFTDVTDQVFGSDQTGSSDGTAHREQFAKDVLAHEGVCHDMACGGSSIFK